MSGTCAHCRCIPYHYEVMSKLVPLTIVALLLCTACGHPIQGKLEGRWIGQAVENFDDDKIAAATGWAKGTSMEFSENMLTVIIPAEDPRSGIYEVVRAHQNDVYLKVARKNGGTDKVHFKLDDEHSIRWMLDDGDSGSRAIVMRREN